MDKEPSGLPDQESDEAEPGEPITALRGFSEDPQPTLLEKVRAGIERRQLTDQVVELYWFTPLLVILEYVRMLVALFRRR